MRDRDRIEKSLLLCVVNYKQWEKVLRNTITRDCFSPANLKLYDYVFEFTSKNTYPDIKVIANVFDIDDVQLRECLSYKDSIDELCRALFDEYIKDLLYYKVKGINAHQEEMFDNPTKYIERMANMVAEMQSLSYQTKSVGLFDKIESLLDINSSDVISTGFKELDKVLVGWKRGEELVVFVGRTGQGKSWMCLKFAMSAALEGEKVGIYSGEMSQQQLQERILCCAKQSTTSTKEEAMQFIKDKNIDIRLLTQKELRKRASVRDIEEFIVRDNLSIVVIDQLSLMEDVSVKPGVPLRQILNNITMDLFTLSGKYGVPIILAVQSNREGGENKEGPTLDNIAESDAIAQNATRVITMKNDTSAHILTLNVVKNRYGETGFKQQYDIDFGRNKYKPIGTSGYTGRGADIRGSDRRGF